MSTPRIRLDRCVIHVSDWDHSDVFYRDVLGAEVVRFMGVGAAYRLPGRGQLDVHGPGATPTPLARIPVPLGGSDLSFEWPGPIVEAMAHLERCAVAVELGPVRRPDARGFGQSVHLRDLDGSLVEFIPAASP